MLHCLHFGITARKNTTRLKPEGNVTLTGKRVWHFGFSFVVKTSLKPPALSPKRHWPKTGDVAQLAESRTGTPLTQVRFPGAAKDFSPGVNFPCRLSSPLCVTACIYSCAHISMHRSWLGSATLLQLAFLGESDPNLPWEESQWDDTVVKNKQTTTTKQGDGEIGGPGLTLNCDHQNDSALRRATKWPRVVVPLIVKSKVTV